MSLQQRICGGLPSNQSSPGFPCLIFPDRTLLRVVHEDFNPYLFSSVFDEFCSRWSVDELALQQCLSGEVDENVATALEKRESLQSEVFRSA
jgi:hypothetical protein